MQTIIISPYSNFNSYGVKSVCTHFRQQGDDVTCVYLPQSFDKPYSVNVLLELLTICRGADRIGISLMSNYFKNAVRITHFLKRSNNSCPVIWGGIHPRVAREECLEYCDEVMDISPLQMIDNDFSRDYVLDKGKIKPITTELLRKYITQDYMTLTSFGCSFTCSYCINSTTENKVEFRSADNILSELIAVRTNMPWVKHVSFDDDAFMQRSCDDLRKFMFGYKARIGLPFFVSGLNPLFVTEEKMDILISAGMDRVRMGIQTGSVKTQKTYNRNITNEQVIEAAKIINQYSKKLVLTGYDIILDNPFEREEELVKTSELLTQIPAPFTLNLFSLTFYPGTELYEQAQSDNEKHYHDIQPTYLNFIILLFTVFRVPAWLLRRLLKIKAKRVPVWLFEAVKLAGYARRALSFLVKGDIYTLKRHLRFKLVK